MRVLVDCDGVLSDFVSHLLHELKAFGAIPLDTTPEHITDYNIGASLGISWDTINQVVYRPGFCANMMTYPEALPWLHRLRKIADVTVVTAPYKGSRHWIGERIWWLKGLFGLEESEICVWSEKHRIEGDLLIDDAPKHVEAYDYGWLMARPWNADSKHPNRGGYEEIIEAVRREL
jgi:5'(3')-deoxyribonucleotidase